MSRPKVKICGVRTPEEAELAVALGADFLGLNFHPPSPRCLAPAAARRVADAVRGRATLVGVFVHQDAAEIAAVDAAVGLDLIQLHGEHDAGVERRFAGRAIRVVRVDGAPEADAVAGAADLWGFLFDTRHPSLWGGTGEGWDSGAVGRLALDRPCFIAGGLGPDNVRAAVDAARPWGIDACSGVEASPGRKDPDRLRRFFEEIDHGTSARAS